MRIVITGASGNVGSALVRRLADDGGHELVGVVRRPPTSEVSFPAMEWVAVDLTDDADTGALHAACEGADAVVHLAWGFQPSHREAHLRALGVGGTGARHRRRGGHGRAAPRAHVVGGRLLPQA